MPLYNTGNVFISQYWQHKRDTAQTSTEHTDGGQSRRQWERAAGRGTRVDILHQSLRLDSFTFSHKTRGTPTYTRDTALRRAAPQLLHPINCSEASSFSEQVISCRTASETRSPRAQYPPHTLHNYFVCWMAHSELSRLNYAGRTVNSSLQHAWLRKLLPVR